MRPSRASTSAEGGIILAASHIKPENKRSISALGIVFGIVFFFVCVCLAILSAETLVEWKSYFGGQMSATFGVQTNQTTPVFANGTGAAGATVDKVALNKALEAITKEVGAAKATQQLAKEATPAVAKEAAPTVAKEATPAVAKEVTPKAKAPKLSVDRCALTKGDWCGIMDKQKPVSYKKPPRGSKDCVNNCNKNIGVCNFDIGICDCPAGWTGNDCMTPYKRPCTNGWRGSGKEPRSHIDANGRDRNWTTPGWTASRCGGICDDDLGMCNCDGKFKYIPAPAGSPYGARPVQRGRPLPDHCKPKTTKEGTPTNWGAVEYDKLYGTGGWCEADNPGFQCGCTYDGWDGKDCNEAYEAFCPNQCSGHGQCVLGWCKCYSDYYGTDCARKKAGTKLDQSDIATRPWLPQYAAEAPAALEPPPRILRQRPLIYVYDLPSMYNTRLLQYRSHKSMCIWRQQHFDNSSHANFFTYAVETYMHEMLLQSSHRTFDPEEADFFYVPIYTGCYMHPVHGWADAPWWGPPSGHRVIHASNMLLEVQQWLQTNHPYWNRSQGADHIWLAAHDEGACWYPTVVYKNSIILTHWGRMDLNHTSNTAYDGDRYDAAVQHPEFQPKDWRLNIKGHACYTPGKDLVIPAFKDPNHYRQSPLMGAKPRVRDLLVYFRGDVGLARLAWYSRGIRQKLHKLVKQHGWKDKHKIIIGSYAEAPGDYSELLSKSKYCLVAPGDGWSPRMEDAVLHGCVPLIIMDDVHAVFESVLDLPSFTVRVSESDLEKLPDILNAITEAQLREKQANLRKVWQRYAYATGSLLTRSMNDLYTRAKHENPRDQDMHSDVEPYKSFPHEDDAFNTIMQWLASKVKK